jgi:hypothetical protein
LIIIKLDMDWKIVAKLGLKILASTVAGVIIFMGIDKAVGGDKVVKNNNNQPQPIPNDNMFTGSTTNSSKSLNEDNNVNVNSDSNKKSTVVSGLKGAVNSCGKLYLLTQSLATLAENIGRLFNNDQEYYTQPYNNDPWFSGGYNYGTGYNNGWSRINPYVISATPSPQGPIFNTGNNYPF